MASPILSPDGRWQWDGKEWVSAVGAPPSVPPVKTKTPDGRLEWDGKDWVPVAGGPPPAPDLPPPPKMTTKSPDGQWEWDGSWHPTTPAKDRFAILQVVIGAILILIGGWVTINGFYLFLNAPAIVADSYGFLTLFGLIILGAGIWLVRRGRKAQKSTRSKSAS